MNKRVLHTAIIILWIIFVSGCSTDKNTVVTRAYNNLTSRYNVHFNAEQSLKAGEAKIDKTVSDDYTHLLPIFKDSDPSTANTVKSDMDNVILKSSKLIKIHSMTKKPRRHRSGGSRRYQEFARKEEFNNWVDDSYVLMGKAYFLEDKFPEAIQNFNYVVRKFPDESTKYEALVWLIRCYTETQRFVEAEGVIKSLEGDDNFPQRLERELAIVIADYNIKMKNYDEGIKYLDIAIRKTFWKKQKARLQYIMAQLYEKNGQDAQAAKAFAEVLRQNPTYEMEFNAKINFIELFTDQNDVEKIKKELVKMLNDKKNFEYRDQIYYALGNIYNKAGDEKNAIQNYRSSVASSVTNSFQLAQSAITLANLYFKDMDYRDSHAYYDSAMIVIDNTYPDYENISDRYNSLTRLVDNIFTVEREDSLQKVASMDENKRNALIDKLIAEAQKKQKQAELQASQGRSNSAFYRANQYRLGMGTTQMGTGWYFYNPQTVAFGKVQFQQRWGRRQLGDDWRRSDKTTTSEEENNATPGEAADTTAAKAIVKVDDPLQREYYTQDLPLNDSLIAVSNEKIKDALYNAGRLFKTEFNNYDRSNKSFEELNQRFPNNVYTLSSYFDLYDNYELLKNKERSDYYRNLIINKFPDSKYAQYLQNPNFFVDMQAQKDSINKLYQSAFEKYQAAQYPQVITLTAQMKQLNPDSALLPKIDFLRSVALGTQSDMPTFESLMSGYIKNYPKAEPTPLAQNILSLIQDSTLTNYQKLVDSGYLHDVIQNKELLPGNQKEDQFGGKFDYDEDLLHYFVIAYPRDANVDVNRLKFDIANYNIDNYTKIDFDIESANLNDKTALLLVRSLANKEQSLIYYRSIIGNSDVFESLKNVDYISFVASSSNYRAILEDKSLTDYLSFFVRNYSKFTKPEFENKELLNKPEELMAKAQAAEDTLVEQGTYVLVPTTTAAANLFDMRIDTAQCFVLAIKGDEAPIRNVTSRFSDFNTGEFRRWHLELQLKRAADYHLLVVKGIPDFNNGMSYFRRALTQRDLFAGLENISYRNFLITDENLARLTVNGKVDDYLNFFRSQYLQANIPRTPQPAAEAGDTTKAVQQPLVLENNVNKDTSVYTGPYNPDIEGPHLFVFIIPQEGINTETFKSGLSQYNKTAFPDYPLTIEEQPLDTFRNTIKIAGLPDKNSAMLYAKQIVQKRDLFAPLGTAEYRNFLITGKNFDIFLKEKNINAYMNFYKQFYLRQ